MKASHAYKTKISTRSDLLTLLSEACELEHGLACSYLYTAFSLKQSVTEGLSTAELVTVKKWAAQIFLVASQEMLHLSQAWNLLTAIGGSAYYFRPNFPQESKYYPLNLPLKLEPFGTASLKRFILYELPSDLNEKEYVKQHFGFVSEDDYNYKTVGELYRMIKDGFLSIDEGILFINDDAFQIGSDIIDFPEIIRVVDRKTAVQAIDMITEQGEGTNQQNREDCHYGIFLAIEKDLEQMTQQNPGFSPARDCADNPCAYDKGNYGAKGTLITNTNTREIADLFDDIYSLMLKVLQYVFTNNETRSAINKRLGSYALQLMVRIIKPLGEALSTLPLTDKKDGKTAGAGFGMTRHVPFPNNPTIVFKLVSERHQQIQDRLQKWVDYTKKVPESMKPMAFHFSDVGNVVLNFKEETMP